MSSFARKRALIRRPSSWRTTVPGSRRPCVSASSIRTSRPNRTGPVSASPSSRRSWSSTMAQSWRVGASRSAGPRSWSSSLPRIRWRSPQRSKPRPRPRAAPPHSLEQNEPDGRGDEVSCRCGASSHAREEVPVDPKAEASSSSSEQADRPRRVIKRYSNRKLYDTKGSRYVTLLQVAEMVREGEEVQIIDNNTKDDLTEITLAQIIYEEQKARSRSVPLQTLKELIHTRTEKVLADLREGPIGRLIPGGAKATDEKAVVEAAAPAKEARPGLVDQAKEKLEEVQHQLDDR